MKTSGWTSLVLLCAVLLSACSAGNNPGPAANGATALPPVVSGNSVVAEGRLAPRQFANLEFSAAGGLVAQVLAAPGQAVAAGDVLMKLDGAAYQTALAQAQAGVTVAEARLAQAKAPASEQDIAAAEARIKAAQALADQAAAQRDQVGAYAGKDDITIAEQQLVQAEAQLRLAEAVHDASKYGPGEWQARQQRDAAAAAVEIARARLNQVKTGATVNQRKAASSGADAAAAQVLAAQADLARLKAGAGAADLAVLQAQIDQAKAGVDAARAALDALVLRAPFAGSVTAVNFKVGERVSPGRPAVTLADDSAWIVETRDLTELEVVRVKEGQQVGLTLDALPGVALNGTVLSIGKLFVEKQGDITYVVKIALNETRPEMRWGMTAAVTFGE